MRHIVNYTFDDRAMYYRDSDKRTESQPVSDYYTKHRILNGCSFGAMYYLHDDNMECFGRCVFAVRDTDEINRLLNTDEGVECVEAAACKRAKEQGKSFNNKNYKLGCVMMSDRYYVIYYNATNCFKFYNTEEELKEIVADLAAGRVDEYGYRVRVA